MSSNTIRCKIVENKFYCKIKEENFIFRIRIGGKGNTGDVGDIEDYTEKTSLSDDDLFLIQDSQIVTPTKKKIKASNLGFQKELLYVTEFKAYEVS
jgi:hypothetical protein